jgi:hypothetical protein
MFRKYINHVWTETDLAVATEYTFSSWLIFILCSVQCISANPRAARIDPEAIELVLQNISMTIRIT